MSQGQVYTFQPPPPLRFNTLSMVEAQINQIHSRSDDPPSPGHTPNDDDNGSFDFKNKTLDDFHTEEHGRPKRIKTTNACQPCQRKKVRCEGTRPCLSCQRLRLECVPSSTDPGKKRPQPRTVEEIIQERLDNIESILSGLFDLMPQAKETPDADVKRMVATLFKKIMSSHLSPDTISQMQMKDYFPEPDEGAVRSTNEHSQTNDKTRPIKPLPRSMSTSIPSPVSTPTSTPASAPMPRPAPPPMPASASNKPETLDLIQPSSQQQQYSDDGKEVQVIDALDEMFGKLKLSIDSNGRFVGETTAYHFPKDRVQNGIDSATPFQFPLSYTPESHLPYIPEEYLNFPSKNSQLKLTDLYFKYVHPYIPVINQGNFRQQLDEYHSSQHNSPPVLAYAPGIGLNPLLLWAVLAISAKYMHNPPLNYFKDHKNPSTIGEPFFDAATKLIDYFMDTPRISTVAALILLAKHLEDIKQSNTLSRSWMLAGMAFRMAQDLGLNRDCENWGLSQQACQLRKRVFWSLFAFDRVFSGGYGRPMIFDEKDCNIGYPKPDHEDDPLSQNMIRDFVEYVKLTKIIGRILKYNYSPQSCEKTGTWTQDTMLITLDSTLASWLMYLPDNLRWIPAANQPRSHLGDYAKILHMLFHSVLILLHRPYIALSKNVQGSATNPTPKRNTLASFPSMTICTHAANLITELGLSMINETPQDLRKLNAGVYCLFTAARVHLMNVASSEYQTATQAESSFESTLKTLNKLMEHDPYHGDVVPDTIHTLQTLYERQKKKRGHIIPTGKKQPRKNRNSGMNKKPSTKPTSPINEPIVRELPIDMEQIHEMGQLMPSIPIQMEDETARMADYSDYACINSAESTSYESSNSFSNSSSPSPSSSPYQSSQRSESTTPPMSTLQLADQQQLSEHDLNNKFNGNPYSITLLDQFASPVVNMNFNNPPGVPYPLEFVPQSSWQQPWYPCPPYPYEFN